MINARGNGWKRDQRARKWLEAALVDRDFTASEPNQKWVSDFTYVPTLSGMVYVAFVIDLFSRMIVGWSVSKVMDTDFVLDALEMAFWQRANVDGLIHHSDRGSQYTAIRYGQRLTEAGVLLSVGSRGDSYDNATAESTIGLYKTELIEHEQPQWRNVVHIEMETLKYVEWFNNERIHGTNGDVSPVAFEAKKAAA